MLKVSGSTSCELGLSKPAANIQQPDPDFDLLQAHELQLSTLTKEQLVTQWQIPTAMFQGYVEYIL